MNAKMTSKALEIRNTMLGALRALGLSESDLDDMMGRKVTREGCGTGTMLGVTNGIAQRIADGDLSPERGFDVWFTIGRRHMARA